MPNAPTPPVMPLVGGEWVEDDSGTCKLRSFITQQNSNNNDPFNESLHNKHGQKGQRADSCYI